MESNLSIPSKGPQLLSYLHANPLPHILFFSETWLTPHHNESIIGLPDDYTILRRDHCQGRCGGGVVVYLPLSMSLSLYRPV